MRGGSSRWLFHRELTWEGAGTEEPVMLDQPVPVYITYMTAMPDGQSIAYYDDAYGRDKAQAGGQWRRDSSATARPRAAEVATAPGRHSIGPGDVLGDRAARGRRARG